MVVCLYKPHPPHPDMTVVINDPTWLPWISNGEFLSYFAVVSFTTVVYDWALTFGQEFELIWRQRRSFMTVLYLCVRYIGVLYSVITIPIGLPVPMTDVVGSIVYFMWIWMPVVVNAMLGVIIMIQIYAMYGRSKKMLVFLIVVLLASTISSGVMTVVGHAGVSAGEFIALGYHLCLTIDDFSDRLDLSYESLISTAIWEILAFILAVWIVIKHLRELRQSPTGSTIGDCFIILIQSHAFYFVAFATVACFTLGSLSANITFSSSVGSTLYTGVLGVVQALQMFVLGPRLILSIRKYHAELVARSDEGTRMTSIHFQAGGDSDALTSGEGVLTGGDV
ncbi:hypothetical protein BDR06DRAFT_754405 [Suillus hirtellus]|nr:hypothetical protein BDR06DRAFT_754405 [Suillus hirtellus]